MRASSDSGHGSDESGTGQAIFDLGGGEQPPFDPYIPSTCAEAESAATTLGCEFYGTKLPQFSLMTYPVGVVVANPQETQEAHVTAQVNVAGTWVTASVEGDVTLAPGQLATIPLGAAPAIGGSAIEAKAAYRVIADVPIVTYQFNPIAKTSKSSDASLLYPTPSWDDLHHVLGWEAIGVQDAYVAVIAKEDGTKVDFTVPVATPAGAGIPAATAGSSFSVVLDDGDVARVATANFGESLSGAVIASNKPVAVFSGNECTYVPSNVWTCDHLEEQTPGVRLWGTAFVAARMPVREVRGTPEAMLWQIVASEDATTVEFDAPEGVTGVPTEAVVLDGGELIELWVSGTFEQPGDFVATADKPIGLLGYMTSQENLVTVTDLGDPSMAYAVPLEQQLPRYVVLVPNGWDFDFAVLTRATGSTVSIDGVPVDGGLFTLVNNDFEVARVPIEDGVHRIESDEPLGVEIVGYDIQDSYAYSAGAGTMLINPNPAG